MENLLILLFILCTTIIYIFHKNDLEPFQIRVGEPELLEFESNKKALHNKLLELDKAMKTSPRSVRMNDNIVQNYKLQLAEINKMENEQIKNTNNYNINIINNLENKLDTLEKIVGSNNERLKQINAAQSYQDGLKVNLKSVKLGQYNVMINDGCLDVKSSNKYGVEKCNPNKDSQLFDAKYISNDAFYNSTLEHGLDKVQTYDKIQYPFYVLKSSNTNNCLQNNFGHLSIEPCVVRKGQRWKDLDKPNKCDI